LTLPLDQLGLLAAIANALAASAGVAGPDAQDDDGKRTVFVGAIIDEHATPARAALACFGGTSPRIPVQQLDLQLAVYGTDDADALDLAERLLDALFDDKLRPRREWELGRFERRWLVLSLSDPQRPGRVGREAEAVKYAANFSAQVARLPDGVRLIVGDFDPHATSTYDPDQVAD
jgi:hypothetical protein